MSKEKIADYSFDFMECITLKTKLGEIQKVCSDKEYSEYAHVMAEKTKYIDCAAHIIRLPGFDQFGKGQSEVERLAMMLFEYNNAERHTDLFNEHKNTIRAYTLYR